MILLDNEQVLAFDVDDTLVMWDFKYDRPDEGRVAIHDPYDSSTVYLMPHARHVKFLKQCKGRGRSIVVWSQGGCHWAQSVVNALGLSEYVDLVLTKPIAYVDDLPASAWLTNRIYLKEGSDDVE